jgi:serine/threonine protein kinase/tetratricopeptide (TPR) repeat protein
MGTVWMAEQQEPVRRTVALKVIKPGMDSRACIARFEAERQALAMMDHPNIARVFDAGTIDAGQPYFVMELVQGPPITDYCDGRNVDLNPRFGRRDMPPACQLARAPDAEVQGEPACWQCGATTRQRLELFLCVCRAVQHAHQKGIIHRDLKPSNVLVPEIDGVPVPKVIDFGIAKATEQRLTPETMVTGLGQFMGTLEYMSPEQATLNVADIDTRSDIYSLGVLLYELLTGSTPITKEALRQVTFDEILRTIRETVPLPPSRRLAQLTAANTNHSPIDKDLDWIVMKALEKDRARRYETAAGLAADVERYLRDEPVEASPPSHVYRLRKFARRNKALLATAATILFVLVAASIVSTWMAVRAISAETTARGAEADAKEVLRFFEDHVFAAARPLGQEGGLGRNVTLREAVDEAEGQIAQAFAGRPLVEASIRNALSVTFRYSGEPKLAISQAEQALWKRRSELGDNHPDTWTSMNNLGLAYLAAGRPKQALPLFEFTRQRRQRTLGDNHTETLASMQCLALAYQSMAAFDRAIAILEPTLEKQKRILGEDHLNTLRTTNGLALAYKDTQQHEKAHSLLIGLLEVQGRKLGESHQDTLQTMHNLASVYGHLGQTEVCIDLYEECMGRMKQVLGPDHPDTLAAMMNLGNAYKGVMRLDEAMSLLEEVLERTIAKHGPDHPKAWGAASNLAGAYAAAGAFRQGHAPPGFLPVLERAVKGYQSNFGPAHPDTLATQTHLAAVYGLTGRFDSALPLFEEVLELSEETLGEDHPKTWDRRLHLAVAYRKANQPQKAVPLLEQLLEMRTKKLGPTHNATRQIRIELSAARTESQARNALSTIGWLLAPYPRAPVSTGSAQAESDDPEKANDGPTNASPSKLKTN